MRKLNGILAKILLTVFITTNALVLPPATGLAAPAKTKGNYSDRAKTEILVKYKNEDKKENVESQVKGKLKLGRLDTKRQFKKSRTDVLEIDKKDNLDNVLKELKNNPDVEYAQPNYKLTPETAPADPRFNEQWSLLNNGQEVEGQAGRTGVDINAIPAWDITRGSSSTVVGLMDTGVDISHNDLKDNIYVNAGEIPGNGIDDDGNGYIDDVNGWDFANDDAAVYDSKEVDTHGTYTAGIIAAKSDSAGIAGVAPNVKILPLKFINGDSGYTCDAIEAIEYAMQKGVKIINCSFGGTDNNYALKDAMQNSGILFVCSAGNRGGDVASMPVYPACFDIPNVLSVAAIDGFGVLASFSGYGSKIHVAAPGMNVLSTVPGNNYDYFSGTSVSAPIVTGIAALVKSYLPDRTYTQIADRIKNNVVACTTLQGKVTTGGRVNAFAALTNTPPQPDTYNGPGGETPTIPGGQQGGEDDTWYTQDQLAKIKEKLHYGESGVSPASGNFSFTVNDMSIPAPGFQVNISRTYNSRDDKSSPLGRGWTFGFEGSATGTDVVSASLPNGSVQRFRKNGSTYTPEDSRSVFVKNADNTYTLTTKDQYSYGFNTNGWLTWMKDRNGNTLTITVDTQGKVQSITDTVGRQYTVTYNAQGLIDNIRDPEDRTVRYEYDVNNYLVRAIDPMGGIMRYGYDTEGFLNKIQDHNNKTVESIVYNHSVGENQHKVSQAVDALGDSCNYAYDMLGRKTTVTDINGRIYTYWFDTSMYTIKEQDPEGKYTLTEYFQDDGKNKYGEVASTTDRNGNKTEHQRDGRGNITKTINPNLNFKEFTYDDKNNLIMEKDEQGKPTYYIYDAEKKNLVKKVQPLNGTDEYQEGVSSDGGFAVTGYTYYTAAEARTQFGLRCNVAGLLKSVADPEGNTTEYTYDINGYIHTTKDPENNITTDTYNAVGWKISTLSPGGYTTTYTYDKNGLLEKTVQQGGETTRIIYDILGRKIKEISPRQYNSADDDLANHAYSGDYGYRYEYYDNDKLKSVKDPAGCVTSYTYDVYGNTLTETRPNGSVYRYEYDVLDRVSKTYFKDDAAASEILLKEYTYAILADGRTQKTETVYLNDTEKASTVSIYDYAGRLAEHQYPDGTKTKTAYNANGTINTTTAQNGSITYYRYDGLNRLSEQWTPFEITNGNILYTYSKVEYDKAGRKTVEKAGKDKVALFAASADLLVKNYSYYKDGKTKTVTDDEGRKTAYEYDGDGNLSKEEVYTGAASKLTTEYIYNYLGKPTEKKVHVQAGDIAGNDFGSTQDTVLVTSYSYDKNGNQETSTTPDNVVTTYTYDNMNRQLSVSQPGQDENGAATSITKSTTYNWEGKPLTTVDSNGNTTLYTYTKRGLLEKTTDPGEGVTLYAYDRAGRKTAEVSPKNYDPAKTLEQMNRVEYVYDLMGRVTTKLDKYYDAGTSLWVSINTKSYRYDGSGNVVKELDASGYDAGSGSTADERINTGCGTEYTYNLAGKLMTVLDPVSREKALPYTTKYEYDGLGRKTSETNANGVITLYVYDNAGSILSVKVKKNATAEAQTVKSSTYDLAGRQLTQTDGNGNTATFEYNGFSKQRRVVFPGDATILANIVTYQYDGLGNLKVQKDSTGKMDLYTYDNQGRVLSQMQQKEDGTQAITTSVRYDKNGNKRFETDGNGTTKENRYDALNRLTETRITVNGILKTTTYGYDKNGNQTTQTDWRGNTYANVYDPLNRLVEKRDPYTTIQRLEYNKNSVQVKSWDALNHLTQYQYDKNNRPTATTDPEGHTTHQSYDNVGNVQTKTDGRNITTTYNYDEFNRLKSVVNAKSETTAYTYDKNGNMLTQTDGEGHTTTYEYDAANKPIRKIDHGGRTGMPGNYTYIDAKVESYTYYADGSMHTKVDRNGETTTYTYDVHGRLLLQEAEAASITYTYDNNGNQLTMTDSTGVTERTYDAENRTLTKTVPNVGQTVFQYDILTGVATGYAKERSTDPKGNITEKIFDKAGRLKTVTGDGQSTTYNYRADGSRESVVYDSGAREDYTYYDDGLLHTLTNKKADGTVIDTYSYTYDGAHNQTTKSDNTGFTSYIYDSLNRLERVTEQGGSRVTGYTYDRAGNRATETITVGTVNTVTVYSYDEQNRLMSTTTSANGGVIQKTVYQYDNNGNMVSKSDSETKPAGQGVPEAFTVYKSGETTDSKVSFYEYNEWNQMVKTTTDNQITVSEYNGDGSRVSKTVNGQTIRYLYEYDNVVLELDGSGTQTARNVYGTNLLTRTAGTDTYTYMYNGHADVTALLKADGSIAGTYYYDAFGNITEQPENANNNVAYAGYQYDKETGLYYLNARYYDPKTARFLTEDTYTGQANDPLSLNLYTYCHNEPIMYTDPNGHLPIFGGIIKLIANTVGQAVNTATQVISDTTSNSANSSANGVESTSTDGSNSSVKSAQGSDSRQVLVYDQNGKGWWVKEKAANNPLFMYRFGYTRKDTNNFEGYYEIPGPLLAYNGELAILHLPFGQNRNSDFDESQEKRQTNNSAQVYEEPYITEALYINDENDLPVFGHSAIILKFSDGSGIYYSYMASNPQTYESNMRFARGERTEGFLGRAKLDPDQMNKFMRYGTLEAASVKEYAKWSDYKYKDHEVVEAQQFDRYISIPVNRFEGQHMMDAAERIYNDETDTYSLYGNNCNHAAQQILGGASLNFTAKYGDDEVVSGSINQGIMVPISLSANYFKTNLDGTIPNAAYVIGQVKGFFKGWKSGSIPGK